MSVLRLEIDRQVATLSFDDPGSRVNVLSSQVMRELSQVITELAAKTKDIKALLLTSKKDGIFIAGADIREVESLASSEEAENKAREGQETFESLRKLDCITVALINGACLGGGLELVLACRYRVAAFSEKVKIGVPEVMLGLLPGWGGTQRLPRLVGLANAIKMISSGQALSAQKALRCGLVDRLFPQARLLDDALDFVHTLVEGKTKITRKRKKAPLTFFLEETPVGRGVLFSQAKKLLLKKTKGFYPAPLKALEVVRRTTGRSIQEGFLTERRAFGELWASEVSKNLIKVFYLNEEFKRLAWVDEAVRPAPVNKCGVVGAGIMGGGIARLLTSRDLPVRLKDVNIASLKQALKTASDIFRYALKRRKLRRHQVDYKMGLISPTLTYKGFENAGVVIEAVVENLEVKQKVFGELGRLVSPGAVLASNTSSLSITKMAQATKAPEKVVGLHFFNPVHRMPLVEVIKGQETSDETLATIIAFARRLGKVVIVVKDAAGFLINRILLPYMNEAAFLLEEGVRIERIDGLARSFGMPMGPLELADEVGVDVGYKVAKILEAAYGQRMRVASILEQVQHAGLFGKKIKKGFYIYKGRRKVPNSGVYAFARPSGRAGITDETLVKRMIYIMINEAAQCLEEGVVDRPHTVDIGMIMGTGFPSHKGGLLRYADSVGIEHVFAGLQEFERTTDAVRFRPSQRLAAMARENRNFYSYKKQI